MRWGKAGVFRKSGLSKIRTKLIIVFLKANWTKKINLIRKPRFFKKNARLQKQKFNTGGRGDYLFFVFSRLKALFMGFGK
ncbi:hypothetical protein BWI93_19445 [Siphonobacter sp. BAB-5385]|nr:hypothetical protein BWI93_19445 [Siphonobacter sp. BAB-5385]